MDFDLLYPTKANNLIERWDSFKTKIREIFNAQIKDKESQSLLNCLNKRDFSKGPEDVIIIDFMHALLPPSVKHIVTSPEKASASKKRKTIKFTIKDLQEYFLLKVNNINDFWPQIDRLSSKLREKGNTLQPIISKSKK